MKVSDVKAYLDSKGIEYDPVRINEDEVFGFSSLFNYKEGTITFIVPERCFADYSKNFTNHKITLMIMGENAKDSDCFSSVLRVKDPRAVFFDIVDGLFDDSVNDEITGIFKDSELYQKYSYISPKADIGEGVRIGIGCVIEGNVVIGDGTEIHHNVVIRNKTKIGKNCTIHSGVVIGEYGFGYVKNEQKEKQMLKHYGGVVIEDDVHIGDNSVIIRGAIDDTVIHKGVKINTMVHIAHNDEIGEGTMITSPCHICGSATIGKNCHIAGAIIRNQRVIGDEATIGLGAIVVKDVDENTVVVGNPAREIK